MDLGEGGELGSLQRHDEDASTASTEASSREAPHPVPSSALTPALVGEYGAHPVVRFDGDDLVRMGPRSRVMSPARPEVDHRGHRSGQQRVHRFGGGAVR